MKLPIYSIGSGDEIVLIHGIISDAAFFDELSIKLGNEFKVVSYDRRGYGNADKPADNDYSVAAQAEDAKEVIESTAQGPVYIVGNSAGAIISIELALRYPKLVKGLILIEPSIPYDDASEDKMMAWNRELNGYIEAGTIRKALPAFAKVIEGNKESVSDMPGSKIPNSKKMNMAEIKRTYSNLDNFMFGELNEVQLYRPSIEQLRNINVPVKVFVTSNSKNCLFREISENSANKLGWEVVEIIGNHNALNNRPDSSYEAIKYLITELKNGSQMCKI